VLFSALATSSRTRRRTSSETGPRRSSLTSASRVSGSAATLVVYDAKKTPERLLEVPIQIGLPHAPGLRATPHGLCDCACRGTATDCRGPRRGLSRRGSRVRVPSLPFSRCRIAERFTGNTVLLAPALRREINARTSTARVQTRPNRLLGVARQVAVGPVDHLQGGPHQPRQLEDRDAGDERLGRARVPQVVAAPLGKPASFERRVPLSVAPGVESQ
jgi:hypothetical protein